MPATFIGPVSPPSPWSLDGVPGTILDIIVGHVAQQARQDHACVSTDCLCKRANDRSVINFTPNIKNLSMVDNTFRHNVMSRLIFHTIEVGSRKNIIKLRKKVRECSLRSVRYERCRCEVCPGDPNLTMVSMRLQDHLVHPCLCWRRDELGWLDVAAKQAVPRLPEPRARHRFFWRTGLWKAQLPGHRNPNRVAAKRDVIPARPYLSEGGS